MASRNGDRHHVAGTGPRALVDVAVRIDGRGAVQVHVEARARAAGVADEFDVRVRRGRAEVISVHTQIESALHECNSAAAEAADGQVRAGIRRHIRSTAQDQQVSTLQHRASAVVVHAGEVLQRQRAGATV